MVQVSRVYVKLYCVSPIIENNEAQLRLLVKNNYPGQQELQDSLEVHREMKQMSLEAGREIKITSYTIIETGRN